MVPVGLKVATTRLALTFPLNSLRSETRGEGRLVGKTVRNEGADGDTPVRLTTTAVAFEGTEASPSTFRVRVPPAETVRPKLRNPLHWAAPPVRPDGFPGLVSQIRTGAGSGVNWAPVPPVAV